MKKFTLLMAAALLASAANADVIWTGNTPLDSGDITVTDVESKTWENVNYGDKIVLSFDNLATGEDAVQQITMVTKDTEHNWNWTEFVGWQDFTGNTYTYTLEETVYGSTDQSVLEMLKASGFFAVKGKGANLTKVEIISAGTTPEEPKGEQVVVYEGDAISLDGDSQITGEGGLNANFDWNSVNYGDKIIVSFSEVSTDTENSTQITMVTKDVEKDWAWTEFVAWQNVEGNSYSYNLANEVFAGHDCSVLEMLQASQQLILKGKNGKFNKVVVEKAAGSNVEAIDAEVNAPAEYYTLQGVRVNEPAKGSLYIVRKGSKASKVIF